MTAPVKTFTAKVTDEYGGVYPQAIVAIRAFSETSQNTGISENCEENYKVETELEAISYQVNYWYSAQTKAQGRRSRPLATDEAGEFTDVFEVNLELPEVINTLSSNIQPTEKVLQVIKLDFMKKFV